MISNDLANLADRLLGHAQHSRGPSPVECSRIAAELRKLSQIVAAMEGMPIVVQTLKADKRGLQAQIAGLYERGLDPPDKEPR